MNNFELIRHIKERRPLWDRMCWEKVDARAREVMWDEVAEIMGYSSKYKFFFTFFSRARKIETWLAITL